VPTLQDKTKPKKSVTFTPEQQVGGVINGKTFL
jgi:hypothetical protein